MKGEVFNERDFFAKQRVWDFSKKVGVKASLLRFQLPWWNVEAHARQNLDWRAIWIYRVPPFFPKSKRLQYICRLQFCKRWLCIPVLTSCISPRSISYAIVGAQWLCVKCQKPFFHLPHIVLHYFWYIHIGVPQCVVGLAYAAAEYNDTHATLVTRVSPTKITYMHMGTIMSHLVHLNVTIFMRGMRGDVKGEILLTNSNGTQSKVCWNSDVKS